MQMHREQNLVSDWSQLSQGVQDAVVPGQTMLLEMIMMMTVNL